MRKWCYYSIGVIIIAIFLVVLKFLIGSRVLDLADIYIPYYNPSEYYQHFFILWKTSDSGGIGNAPVSMLYGLVLSWLGVSYLNMQFVIFSILIFSDYSSLFILISYIADGRNKIALLLTIFLLMVEFKWAGLLSATGLNFFLAFSPLLVYFSLRIFKSEITPSRSVIFISLCFVGASFEITEAFTYTLFIYFPIIIMSLIKIIIKEQKLKEFKIFIEKQLTFFGGALIGLIILIYEYYPWILASLGVGSGYIPLLRSTFLNTNIFLANGFTVLGSGPSVLGDVFGLPGIFALIYGIAFIFVMGIYIAKRNRNIVILSAFIFIISLVIYVQLAISFPNQLFHIVTSIPLINEILITLNEPAEFFYILAIWEYFIVGVAFFDLVQNYGELSKFLKAKFVKNKRRGVYNSTVIKKKQKPTIQIALTILTTILFLSTFVTVSSVANGHSSYTPYGNYNIPNYVPNYVRCIYETSAKNIINGPQKILLLPDYPRVERWEETSSLFFNFPPSNVEQMNLFQSLINDIHNHVEAGAGNILGQMDIGYIAIVKALNQTETGPIIAYDNFNQPYAILGNPMVFYDYFNSSPDFSLISNNRNYSIFRNLNNTGMFHVYSGEASLNDNPHTFVENKASKLNVPPNNCSLLTSNISSVNILGNLIKSAYWTSFGKNTSEEFLNSTIFVSFNSFSSGYYTSYLTSGFPVSPGMKLKFSSQIRAINDSLGTYYDGFDIAYSNETIVLGKYWQNGLYTVQRNSIAVASGTFTVPENVTYILPWISFHNVTGLFAISNLSINIIHTGNYSSFPLANPTSQNTTILSSQSLVNTIASLFPNSALIFTNNTNNIQSISSLNVSIYNNITALPGLYIVPYFYLSEKYGYVGGDGNYSVLNPGSYEMGSLSLSEGTYQVEVLISGNGFGNIQINNKSYIYDTLADGVFTIRVNISVENFLNLNVHNILGEIKLYDIALAGPNMSNNLVNMLNGFSSKLSYYLNPNGNPSYIKMNLFANSSTIVVLKESFSNDWSVSFFAFGTKHTERPFLVNGYQMMFIIPDNSTNISFTFHPPFFMTVQVYLTLILIPTFIFLALIMYVFDIKRRT